jgi:hypothetical protein
MKKVIEEMVAEKESNYRVHWGDNYYNTLDKSINVLRNYPMYQVFKNVYHEHFQSKVFETKFTKKFFE